ncbi:ABC transporter ATP-binding protein [Oceanobacillus halophilus]|uniref:Nickel import system ATP-binding protein NikD n=1 Tax=Oceanobacillus halophilus TaxID=930130 RepID=A0A495A1A7_9BACI|nr:ATP-binding cassette domain-containing protein [Oceanobacillus halophilus]RKQ33154.1 ABC transporter ATP-binding protein [Oceanobacillus halophilus]
MNEKTHKYPPLLEVEDFSLSFRAYKKGLKETTVEVVKRLSMTIHQGEIVAVIGASGSGKSLLVNAILGILPDHAICKGQLKFKGKVLTKHLQEELRGKKISMIPQSVNSLNPLMKVGKQVQEAIQAGDKAEIQHDIFKQVGLPTNAVNKYPFELSGGMARKVLAATAMVSSAELIVADEPTPGLDPKSLEETVRQIKELALNGKGIMFISHDLETALKIADKVVVFQAGETIETADANDFSGTGDNLKHPFTKALWNALPQNEFHPGYVKNLEGESFPSESLEIKSISYKYERGPYVFKNLDLMIRPNEIVGIHGYSGSGKTTMAQVIAGYLKPETGSIQIAGRKPERNGPHPVQLVWQHPEKAINPRWQMRKVLKESNMTESALLDEFGIKQEWLTRWPSELSGGELQRFCIARALHENTRYLIADEMTTMLDAVTQARLWQLVLKLAKERNIGVLAISHDHSLLRRISDRIINFQEISHV